MKIRSLTFGLIFTLLPIQAQATQENINKGRLDLIFLASMLETALVITGSVTTDEDDPEALALAGSSLRESLRSVSALAAGEQLSRAIILGSAITIMEYIEPFFGGFHHETSNERRVIWAWDATLIYQRLLRNAIRTSEHDLPPMSEEEFRKIILKFLEDLDKVNFSSLIDEAQNFLALAILQIMQSDNLGNDDNIISYFRSLISKNRELFSDIARSHNLVLYDGIAGRDSIQINRTHSSTSSSSSSSSSSSPALTILCRPESASQRSAAQ